MQNLSSFPGLLACLLVAGLANAQNQPIQLSADPSTLVAGGGAQTLTVSTPAFDSLASIPLTASWNGASRTFAMTTPLPYATTLAVSLTADDVAMSQLGQFALYDARTNTLIGSVVVPVIYPVAAQATLYDSVRQKLYLTTGASTTAPYPAPPATPDPRFPVNSLISIDINAGTVSATLALNAAGGVMALSDDGSALYVAVAPGTVRKVDPVAWQALGDFAVPKGGASPVNNIITLAVMPGAPSTVAVQYYASDGTGATFGIFDNGVQRANTLGNATAAFEGYIGMIFSPDGKYIFLGDGEYFPATTDRYPIDSTGFSQSTPVKSPGGSPVAIIGTTLYTLAGVSMNWQTMETTGNLGGSLALAADAVNSRILATFSPPEYAPYQALLQAFDLTSQAPLGTLELPVLPTQLFRFGVDGLIAPISAGGGILFFHTPLAGPAPDMTPNGIVSAASFLGGAIAPGEIVSIFGSFLGPAGGAGFAVSDNTVVQPANVEVLFGTEQGTVLFASPNQMNVAAPFDLAPGTNVAVQVFNNGLPSGQSTYSVVATAPALLTRNASGNGLLAMVNQDDSVNSPAPAGSIISLYGTGGGIYPGAQNSVLAPGASVLSAGVQVTIGGQNAQVLYAGAAPDLVSSAFQINVQVPPGTPPGSSVPVVLTIGGQSSAQGVTIEVR